MIIFNFRNFYNRFESEILYYAKKVDYIDYHDDAQDIRIYMWKHIDKFDPTKASLRYYAHIMIVTGFRKVIYDKTKQYQFEESFANIVDELPVGSRYEKKQYPKLVEKILSKLDTDKEIVIFYAILYNEEAKYSHLAKLLNMNYSSFAGHIRIIREKIKGILTEFH